MMFWHCDVCERQLTKEEHPRVAVVQIGVDVLGRWDVCNACAGTFRDIAKELTARIGGGK